MNLFALIPILATLASALPLEPRQSSGVYLTAQSTPGQCLSVNGGASNGARVSLGACSGSSTKWIINGGNNQGIRVEGTNFCLDATTQYPPNYQGLKIWQCYTGVPQQTFYYTGDQHIAVTGGNACVDAGNSGHFWGCAGGNGNQIWSTSSSVPGGGGGGGGTTPPPTNPTSVSVVRNCNNNNQIALTFDDGPYNFDTTIANNLQGGKGTFFFNGNNYGCIYDRVNEIRSLHAQGHTLGSHSWSHPDMTTLSAADMHSQLERVEQAFIRILGLRPLYFRPPYGSYNDLLLQVLSQRGYKKLVLWTDDIGDATGASVQSSQNTINNIANTSPAPHLVLAHSTIQTTGQQVVPYAVGRLRGAGYQLVAVDTCLGNQGEYPYAYVGQPGNPDGNWRC